MHLTSDEHGVMGSYAIIGAHLPIACGAAWRAQYKGAGRRVGLLLRRRHHQHRRLPRGAELRRGVEAAGDLRLREQSLHGIHADRRRHRGAEHPAADRASAYGLEKIVIDGNDADVVYRTAQQGLRQGARRRRPVADRVPDLSPQRPLARRPGQVSPRGRAGEMEGARPDQDLSRAAQAVRRQRRRDRQDRRRREARGRRGDRGLQGRADARRWISSPPTSTPTEASHGGTDLSRRGHPRHRPGNDARRGRRVPRRGRRQGRRRVQGDGRPATSSSGRCACATRRSPSRRSSAPPWARR